MESNNKKSENNKRQIKIYPKHVIRTHGSIVVPEIRLVGKWIEGNARLKVGQHIQITCKENFILIEGIKHDEE